MATDDELLESLAEHGSMDYSKWPELLERILPRLDHIAHHTFQIPSIPLPEAPPPSVEEDVLKQDPSSQESQKENAVPDSPSIPPSARDSSPIPLRQISNPGIAAPSGTLPPQLLSLLTSIQTNLKTLFPDAPPHTAQRLAELILHPKSHYRTLPSYLRALDRVISVSSATTVFPLPSVMPMVHGSYLNGSITPADNESDDDGLSGAALTPIPWLQHSVSQSSSSGERMAGSDLRTESTSFIDGPNGAGSVETVTVTVNGNASLAPASGPITQGELIRQEQEAGIVPVPAHSRTTRSATAAARRENDEDEGEDTIPHARGPEVVGVEDMGPQASTVGFDVEAAVGRKGEGESPMARPLPEEVKFEDLDKEKDGDGDVEVVDADGSVEGAEQRADGVSQNVAPDALDSTTQ